MQKRNIPRSRRGLQAPTQIRELTWRYFVLMLFCAGVLATGFFFAARQHFLSMDYGFKNSKLKKQLEDLEAEKRRLLLAREVTLSPFEIQRVSRALGGERTAVAETASLRTAVTQQPVRNASAIQVKTSESFRPAAEKAKGTVSTLASASRTDASASGESKPSLQLTAMAKLR